MKGKMVFNPSEEQEILALITELRSGEEQKKQKKIRMKLRNSAFYISDFDNSYRGFTCLDFFKLIENNKIVITE